MFKHTPAPWFTHSNNESVSAATITPGFGNTSNTAICSMTSRNEADATLIAAAPELLSVVMQFQKAMELCEGVPLSYEERNPFYEAWKNAKVAIAKAKGGAA